MLVSRLKTFMPRSLYGRAALILLVPIATLLLVVSVVFIQRLYDEVTRQMTQAVVTDLRFVLDRIEASPDDAASVTNDVAEPLDIAVSFGPGRVSDQRQFFDLTGRIVTETLQTDVPEINGIDLVSLSGRVRLGIETAAGAAEVSFSRRRVSARNPHQFLVLIGFTAVLMTVVAFLYLRGQIRPIKRLAAAAEAFGKGQSVRYRPTGATEVRAAGSAFLDMRNRIERQIEQRTTMLSGVSHDLRTPLTRMKLTLSMMEADGDVADLSRDVEDMERMLESFLNFARSDALDDLVAADPAKIAESVVARAKRAGLNTSLATGGGSAESATKIALRPDAVGRALDNLVGNAGRYGTASRVGVFTTERAVRFVVEDDGPGIPDDAMEQAMKPFQRLDAARNQDGGSGVGLGLSIAADIARSHGGSLRLGRSKDMGGLMAELILPRSANFDLGTTHDR